MLKKTTMPRKKGDLRYTQREKTYIYNQFIADFGDDEIGAALGRTPRAIETFRIRNGWIKNQRLGGKGWGRKLADAAIQEINDSKDKNKISDIIYKLVNQVYHKVKANANNPNVQVKIVKRAKKS